MSTITQLIDLDEPALFRDRLQDNDFYEFSVSTGTEVLADLIAVSNESVVVRLLGEVAYALNVHDGDTDRLEAIVEGISNLARF